MKVINDGFKMWSNYLEAIDNFTGGDDKKFGRLMRILCYYGIYGEEIAETDVEKLFFTGVKSSINASIQNIKNGMLGGRKKSEATEENKSFKKPSLEEIKAYCEEKKSDIDPQAFFDYYNKVGWVYGKNKLPIKDWKACVSTWERNNKKYGSSGNVLHSTSSEVL
jgi:hypothetical protein